MQFTLGFHQTELFPEASTDGAPLFQMAPEPTPAEKQYIYKAYQTGKLVYQAPTERELIEWLETHGGGIYKNVLHKFQMGVNPRP